MRIYVAGPYGDTQPKDVIAENVRRADAVGRDLLAHGHQVYVPHKMTHHWEDDARLNLDMFMVLDDSFLSMWADAIVRIPGESKGADWEMARSQELGLVEVDFKGRPKTSQEGGGLVTPDAIPIAAS
tara:strand:+ start:975 stop:1355 length:381 start_codon:yes stop_codon:yes gene_type:complete